MKLDLAPLLKLRQHPEPVLRKMGDACYATVRHALDLSQFDVPRGTSTVEYDEHMNEKAETRPLADTGFVDGPEFRMDRRLSVTWVAGYAHHAAGAIHEGVHWDRQTEPPPHFLKQAFRRSRSLGRKSVKAALEQALKEFFPPK
ncbi:hypothetical protein [Corallococcus silvisoli]|uniref:hypothetical protein n=1 Tax=Corallococcus silvisoli TaxID=2697031 RepID=UPI002E2C62EC|nr:hypothetical protein [Corallococcus silvisoli]